MLTHTRNPEEEASQKQSADGVAGPGPGAHGGPVPVLTHVQGPRAQCGDSVNSTVLSSGNVPRRDVSGALVTKENGNCVNVEAALGSPW